MKNRTTKLFIVVVLIIAVNVVAYYHLRDNIFNNNPTLEIVEEKNTIVGSNEVDEIVETEEEFIAYIPMDDDNVEVFELHLLQSVQETSYYCVPATAQMVLKYHGIEITQDELAKEMNTSPTTGTEYVDLTRILNKYIFNSEVITNNDPSYRIQTLPIGNISEDELAKFNERVQLNISTDDPVFVAVDLSLLYDQMPKVNHMILITGYKIDTNSHMISEYIYIDPYSKVHGENGGLTTVSPNILKEAMGFNEEPAYIY